MNNEEISEYLIRLENQVKMLKHELYKISWYMRGGVHIYDLYYNCGYDDREIMYNIINENLELTKETKMPLL